MTLAASPGCLLPPGAVALERGARCTSPLEWMSGVWIDAVTPEAAGSSSVDPANEFQVKKFHASGRSSDSRVPARSIASARRTAFVVQGKRRRTEGRVGVRVSPLPLCRHQRLNALPMMQLAFAVLLESSAIAITFRHLTSVAGTAPDWRSIEGSNQLEPFTDESPALQRHRCPPCRCACDRDTFHTSPHLVQRQ